MEGWHHGITKKNPWKITIVDTFLINSVSIRNDCLSLQDAFLTSQNLLFQTSRKKKTENFPNLTIMFYLLFHYQVWVKDNVNMWICSVTWFQHKTPTRS